MRSSVQLPCVARRRAPSSTRSISPYAWSAAGLVKSAPPSVSRFHFRNCCWSSTGRSISAHIVIVGIICAKSVVASTRPSPLNSSIRLVGVLADVRLERGDARRREHARQDAAQLVVARRVHVEDVGRQQADVGVDQRALAPTRTSASRTGRVVHVFGAAEHPVVRQHPVVRDLAPVHRVLVAHRARRGVRVLEVRGVERVEVEIAHEHFLRRVAAGDYWVPRTYGTWINWLSMPPSTRST